MPNNLVPLGNATASDIRDIKQPGLLLPVKKNEPPLLIIDWSGKMHALMLAGNHPFGSFEIRLDTPRTGLFVPDVEFLFDFSSATNGSGLEEEKGVLFLEKDMLSVIALQIGNHFDDPRPVPLQQTVKGGSEAARVAFTRWGIGIRNDSQFRTLWEWQMIPKGQDAN